MLIRKLKKILIFIDLLNNAYSHDLKQFKIKKDIWVISLLDLVLVPQRIVLGYTINNDKIIIILNLSNSFRYKIVPFKFNHKLEFVSFKKLNKYKFYLSRDFTNCLSYIWSVNGFLSVEKAIEQKKGGILLFDIFLVEKKII